MTNEITTYLYLVGVDADEAQQNFPFDSEDSAEDYCRDNPGCKVYEVDCTIHLDTIRPLL